MKEDIALLVIVFAVWAALALAYATVPLFAMPGYAHVWGWGSLIFLLLAAVIGIAQRRKTPSPADSATPEGPEGIDSNDRFASNGTK